MERSICIATERRRRTFHIWQIGDKKAIGGWGMNEKKKEQSRRVLIKLGNGRKRNS